MEEAVRDPCWLRNRQNKVICAPVFVDPTALEIIQARTPPARSSFLPPEEGDADSYVNQNGFWRSPTNPNRRAEPYHIVTQVNSVKKSECHPR